jgi:hypothetical protein
MTENVIVIMVRSTLDDVNLLNECIQSLELNLAPTVAESDFVFFVEKDFGELRKSVVLPANFNNAYSFVEIDLSIPEFILEKSEIPIFFPHPTHSNGPIGFGHPGFSIKYRSMCRFFSGAFYENEALAKYSSYIRLDTDSKFLKGADFSLFAWLKSNEIQYGFIKSAIQNDHPDVVRNLRESIQKYVGLHQRIRMPKYLGTRMYYTNFEIGSLEFFRSDTWQKLFNHLDSSAGFYLHRWGDAPVRFAGLWAVGSKKKIKSIPSGFTYFHGDIFES